MNNTNLPLFANKLVASLWFTLSAVLIGVAIMLLADKNLSKIFVMSIPVAGLAYILILMGCQRTHKFALVETVFNAHIAWAGFIVTFAAVLAGYFLNE